MWMWDGSSPAIFAAIPWPTGVVVRHMVSLSFSNMVLLLSVDYATTSSCCIPRRPGVRLDLEHEVLRWTRIRSGAQQHLRSHQTQSDAHSSDDEREVEPADQRVV